MHDSLVFSRLDENLFQGILVVSSSDKLSSLEWLKRIIENSKNKSNLEFQPVLENGEKTLRFDQDYLDPVTKQIEPIRCHCAMLDNKYYTTQIYLVELSEPTEFPERFYDYIHGILIYLDSNDEHCLENLNKWTEYIDLMENCAIKILSCEKANEHGSVPRIDIQNYCIDKGFELIELTADHSIDDDDDDEFGEQDSFERLYKAIQAYVWPNLNYKEKHSSSHKISSNDALITQINRLNCADANDKDLSHQPSSTSANDMAVPSSSSFDPKPGGKDVNAQITEHEADKFESMFSKLTHIKEKASKMENDEERKRYAQQMAIAFWNSIADDDDDHDDDHDDEVLFSNDEDPNHVYV